MRFLHGMAGRIALGVGVLVVAAIGARLGIIHSSFVDRIPLIGRGEQLETASLREQIKWNLKQRNFPMKSVSCPDSVTVEKGNTFNCKIEKTDGTSQEILITQTGSSNDAAGFKQNGVDYTLPE